VLRWFIVTPDMHRVHHSVHISEANRNFGFNLPWWDWIFATYLAQPNEPHQTIALGLPDSGPTERPETLLGMLAMPFRPRQRSSGPRGNTSSLSEGASCRRPLPDPP
jgi:sterol desaturase/sphingolipid hydroxylase (fatty acid hydroxylase superfamily)